MNNPTATKAMPRRIQHARSKRAPREYTIGAEGA